MASAPKKSSASAKPAAAEVEQRRFWLNYPSKLIQRPLIWELSHKFPVVFNIRQASVSEEIGIMCLEIEATGKAMKEAVRWLEKQGVKVEPVEISVMES